MRIMQRWVGVFFLLAAMALAPGVMLGQNAGGSVGQSAASSPLTPELLAKVERLVSMEWTEREISTIFAEPLGLAPSGNTWLEREVDVKDAKGDLHAFGFGRGTDANNQDVFVSVRYEGDAILIFRAHRDGTLVSAVRAEFKTHQVTAITLAEAQANFAAECKLWRENIDKLLADAAKTPQSK